MGLIFTQPAEVVVFGSIAIDLSCDYLPTTKTGDGGFAASTLSTNLTPRMHTSNVAVISPSIGGVGHNVALAAQLVTAKGSSVGLYSLIGEDL